MIHKQKSTNTEVFYLYFCYSTKLMSLYPAFARLTDRHQPPSILCDTNIRGAKETIISLNENYVTIAHLVLTA